MKVYDPLVLTHIVVLDTKKNGYLKQPNTVCIFEFNIYLSV